MINRIVKKKWLTALRSGKFKQGRHSLRNSGKEYCCLGVLCEITGNGKNRKMGDAYPLLEKFTSPGFRGIPTTFVGLHPRTQMRLAKLNDNGTTFEEIARYISRNIKAVD